MTLAVVVITRNEAQNIVDCLDAVRWADDIVVIDAESTDDTVERARSVDPCVRTFVRSWPGFGPQKNFGIEQTSADWILIVDADERITLELHEAITSLLAQSRHDHAAYRIPRRNIFWGRWLQRGGLYPDYQVRLFRKGMAVYNDVAIHENLLVDGTVGTVTGHIDHYTERRIDDHLSKMDGYTTLAAREKLHTRKHVSWSHLVINPVVTWCKVYVFKKGMWDGVPGLINGVFSGMYTFLKYAKLWEMTRVTPPSERLP